MTLLTRFDIANLLGITKKQFDNLSDKKRIKLPPPVSKKGSTYLYTEQSIMEWIATDPLAKKNRQATASQNVTRYPAIDNFLVLKFITSPSPTYKPRGEQLQPAIKLPEVTVVHLDEREDYVPPHSQLTQTFGGGINVYAAPFGARFE